MYIHFTDLIIVYFLPKGVIYFLPLNDCILGLVSIVSMFLDDTYYGTYIDQWIVFLYSELGPFSVCTFPPYRFDNNVFECTFICLYMFARLRSQTALYVNIFVRNLILSWILFNNRRALTSNVWSYYCESISINAGEMFCGRRISVRQRINGTPCV